MLSCHHVRRRSTEQDLKVSWRGVRMVGGRGGVVGMIREEFEWLGRSWDVLGWRCDGW